MQERREENEQGWKGRVREGRVKHGRKLEQERGREVICDDGGSAAENQEKREETEAYMEVLVRDEEECMGCRWKRGKRMSKVRKRG